MTTVHDAERRRVEILLVLAGLALVNIEIIIEPREAKTTAARAVDSLTPFAGRCYAARPPVDR